MLDIYTCTCVRIYMYAHLGSFMQGYSVGGEWRGIHYTYSMCWLAWALTSVAMSRSTAMNPLHFSTMSRSSSGSFLRSETAFSSRSYHTQHKHKMTVLWIYVHCDLCGWIKGSTHVHAFLALSSVLLLRQFKYSQLGCIRIARRSLCQLVWVHMYITINKTAFCETNKENPQYSGGHK